MFIGLGLIELLIVFAVFAGIPTLLVLAAVRAFSRRSAHDPRLEQALEGNRQLAAELHTTQLRLEELEEKLAFNETLLEGRQPGPGAPGT